MRTRNEIAEEIRLNTLQIEILESKNVELQIESLQVCDDKMWYKEGEEEHIVSKRPKKTQKFTLGRIYWNEFFQDEDKPKGEGITIERSEIVKKDGIWQL